MPYTPGLFKAKLSILLNEPKGAFLVDIVSAVNLDVLM
jgi:hypothetical protein